MINTWADVPQAARTKIEDDATKTDYIEGLYQKSAYLVEEMYTRIEELPYLRVQQKHRCSSAADVAASQTELTASAKIVSFLNNVLHSVAGGGALVTPKLLADTEKAMPEFLRSRYPHPSKKPIDSFEVIFFLTAIRGGLPPLYDSSGKLISVAPPGARMP